MAIKEEALEEFLKCFRIALNFILLYSKEHKSFRKAVGELKAKTEEYFAYLCPIEIEFTPNALSIEGVLYSKMNLHKELAALFHQRKIQSLKIDRGITEEELYVFFEKLAMAPKEIMHSGGLALILSGILVNPKISVKDLDYSQLLRGGGEEVKDIWIYMFNNAVSGTDAQKKEEFAKNFEVMIQKFKARDLVENEELKNNLVKFMGYLKKSDQDHFLKASQAILRLIIKDRAILLDKEKAQSLKAFLAELSLEDYAQTFWNEVINDEKFDASSFELFSQLLSKDEHEKVAGHLAQDLVKQGVKKIPLNVTKKIKELFSNPTGTMLVSDIYRRALLSAGGNLIFKDIFEFDRDKMVLNYRFILLNMLFGEKDSGRLEVIVDKLSRDWEKIAQEKDPEYFKCLGEGLRQKKKENVSVQTLTELSGKFYGFIESFIWGDSLPDGFQEILDSMDSSSYGFEEYLKKIFEDGRINSLILKSFFRFFPEKMPDFYDRLKEKSSDLDIVGKIVESLKEIDSPVALPVLESIYSISGYIIKIEIIRIMAYTGRYNRDFIFEILKSPGDFLKKEALLVLSEQLDNQKAMEILFRIPNYWGKNNSILKENLAIIDELKYKRARDYLEQLYRATAFWNFSLKRRIKEVLGRLNV
jgi:hypothetical protein